MDNIAFIEIDSASLNPQQRIKALMLRDGFNSYREVAKAAFLAETTVRSIAAGTYKSRRAKAVLTNFFRAQIFDDLTVEEARTYIQQRQKRQLKQTHE